MDQVWRRLLSFVLVCSLVSSHHAYASPTNTATSGDEAIPTYYDSNLTSAEEEAVQANLQAENEFMTQFLGDVPVAPADREAALKEAGTIAVDSLQEGVQQWANKQEPIAFHVLHGALKLAERAEAIEKEKGKAALDELIAKNHLSVKFSRGGYDMQLEYRNIGGQLCVLAFVNDEGYLLVDDKLVPRDSPALRKFIDSFNHASGAGRTLMNPYWGTPVMSFWGPKKVVKGGVLTYENRYKTTIGRTLNEIRLYDGILTGEAPIRHEKPSVTKLRWWTSYFTSKYEKPTIDDVTLGIAMGGVMQGTLAGIATAIKMSLGAAAFSWEPVFGMAMFTGAYGAIIGAFNKSYINWAVNSGTPFRRALKQLTFSVPYAIGAVMLLTGGSMKDRVAAVSVTTTEGREKLASIHANAVTNNLTRDVHMEGQRLRKITGANDGNVSFKIPGTEYEVNWRREVLEYNLFYLIGWTINLVAIMLLAGSGELSIPWTDIAIPNTVPGTEIKIPFLQLLAMPISLYIFKKYGERLKAMFSHDPDRAHQAAKVAAYAEGLSAKWENSIVGRAVKFVSGNAQKFWTWSGAKKLYSTCRSALSKPKSEASP